jgi:hypothetical protein
MRLVIGFQRNECARHRRACSSCCASYICAIYSVRHVGNNWARFDLPASLASDWSDALLASFFSTHALTPLLDLNCSRVAAPAGEPVRSACGDASGSDARSLAPGGSSTDDTSAGGNAGAARNLADLNCSKAAARTGEPVRSGWPGGASGSNAIRLALGKASTGGTSAGGDAWAARSRADVRLATSSSKSESSESANSAS